MCVSVGLTHDSYEYGIYGTLRNLFSASTGLYYSRWKLAGKSVPMVPWFRSWMNHVYL